MQPLWRPGYGTQAPPAPWAGAVVARALARSADSTLGSTPSVCGCGFRWVDLAADRVAWQDAEVASVDAVAPLRPWELAVCDQMRKESAPTSLA